ncbi:extracellular solute-binding protein [Pendulispora brunnea]|uniref:Extracellular solute-binding protein n=1 Tax=Pendulispora brunnea TaxID=2905690 RepID=A0ABZ2JXY0_9BACT
MDGSTPVSRRSWLHGMGALGALAYLGCKGGSKESGAGAAAEPVADVWARYRGTTINFISENTPPSAAIAANLKPFEDLTGIKVNISQMELTKLVEKVSLDFSSGQAGFHVIYADPYQVLAPFSEGLVDLTKFLEKSDSFPPLENGLSDFITTQLDAGGRFLDRQKLYALPYDTPTMIWHYRADLFQKHKDKMSHDLGFDPTPSIQLTWEQYYAIARWFDKNAKSEIPYGTGHQAKQHDALMCDFSNVLWAYGGDYFQAGPELGLVGTKKPGKSILSGNEAIAAAEFYNKLLKLAHPGSRTWDWDGVASAFQAGQIAMCPNWHEFAASNEKALPGKVGYAPLPRGPKRSANIWGGTGVGINANASDKEQAAAWLFINWATSPATQFMTLASEKGGGTPTRRSVYARPEVEAAKKRPSPLPNILAAEAVNEAWKPENIGLRPKVATWNQLDTILFTQVSRMLAGEIKPDDAMRSSAEKFDVVNKV